MAGNIRIPHETLKTLSSIYDPDEYKIAALKIIGNQIPVLMLNHVLLGVYIYPDRIGKAQMLYRASQNIEEDIWQGKMAHVIAKGPAVCKDDMQTSFYEQTVDEGEWVMAAINNCKQVEINGLPCRIVEDRFIVAKFLDPRAVW